jgi:hypothetical protein
MILKQLIVAAGLAGTLGAATPAFADWYRPTPPAVVVTAPAYGYGYASYGYRGYAPRYHRPYVRRGWEGRRWEHGWHHRGHRW